MQLTSEWFGGYTKYQASSRFMGANDAKPGAQSGGHSLKASKDLNDFDHV